jgi:hypothetical protein
MNTRASRPRSNQLLPAIYQEKPAASSKND